MEKTNLACVVPVEFGWTDLGSWATLWETGDQDENGNVLLGNLRVLNTTNSYLRNESSQVLATVGIEDIIVVVTDEVVLVTHREHAQKVRDIAEQGASLPGKVDPPES